MPMWSFLRRLEHGVLERLVRRARYVPGHREGISRLYRSHAVAYIQVIESSAIEKNKKVSSKKHPSLPRNDATVGGGSIC